MKKILRISIIIISLALVNFNFTFQLPAFSSSLQLDGNSGKKAIRNLKEAISLLLSSTDPTLIEQGKELQSLAFEINPTLYLTNGQISHPFKQDAVCLETDANSLNKLYADNPLFEKVEFISIKINQEKDLSIILQLDDLISFHSLKYICLSSSVNLCQGKGCEAATISKMVEGNEQSDYYFYYSISVIE